MLACYLEPQRYKFQDSNYFICVDGRFSKIWSHIYPVVSIAMSPLVRAVTEIGASSALVYTSNLLSALISRAGKDMRNTKAEKDVCSQEVNNSQD